MSVSKEKFGVLKDGREVSLFTIENENGIKVQVSDFGALLINLFVPNKDGEVKDIVVGFDKFEPYMDNPNFFGGTIGPNANRIAGCKFVIDGNEYKLKDNESGNNLHSDFDIGFHKLMWEAQIVDNGVMFSLNSGDLEMGFPGNKKVSVTYCLGDDNGLAITYEGISDKKTILNLTNHSYFSLAGADADESGLYNTVLQINAKAFTPIDNGMIPTGELRAVEGTPLDFTKGKKIGQDIDSDYEQIKLVNGYDHNFALDNYDGTIRKVATASCDGRTMEVYTDLPGMQLYTANGLGGLIGKDGKMIRSRTSFCMETQYFPNSVNQESFASPVIDAGERYYTTTVYKFVIE